MDVDEDSFDLSGAAEMLRDIYEHRIPFNRELGLEVSTLELDRVTVKIRMQEKLIGNFTKQSLHGGVVASVLDLAGGMVAGIGLARQLAGASREMLFERISRMGTIDLRVDYLRPGRGAYFLTSANVLRTGNKVAVTRMEMHSDRQDLIAVGTGTYIVG